MIIRIPFITSSKKKYKLTLLSFSVANHIQEIPKIITHQKNQVSLSIEICVQQLIKAFAKNKKTVRKANNNHVSEQSKTSVSISANNKSSSVPKHPKVNVMQPSIANHERKVYAMNMTVKFRLNDNRKLHLVPEGGTLSDSSICKPLLIQNFLLFLPIESTHSIILFALLYHTQQWKQLQYSFYHFFVITVFMIFYSNHYLTLLNVGVNC